MSRSTRLLVAVAALTLILGGVAAGRAAADTVALTLSAVAGANGTTIDVVAPGCEPTPPGASEIIIQARDAATGEVGEGAVASGAFDAPGRGSVLIPAGTPTNSFVISVSCNQGALKGAQAFVLAPPTTAVAAQPNFTG
jgi:hypothetical protein